jgi:acyl-CoA reductase-like NAD-dependent aldehyde dehydrogenase
VTDPTGVFIDGQWRGSTEHFVVSDKYTLEPIIELALATEDHVLSAVDAADRAASATIPAGERRDILNRAAALLLERTDEIVAHYVAETGFTVQDGTGELARAVAVLRLCAEEAIRVAGEEIPVASTPGSENRLAFTMRIPVGVVAAIAPFNAPLNTVAHKIGPAIAAGNSVVLKPAEVTPLSSMALVQAFADAGLPPGYLNLVSGPGSRTGMALVRDERVRFVTFTGSTAVGRIIKRESNLARTHLELGANSASIVAADANLRLVTELTTRAGFRKAGQVCTSVQRILVDRRVADELSDRLAEAVGSLRAGDPRAAESDIGPLISSRDAERARKWIEQSGSSRVIGGERVGSVLQPTLVVDPDASSKLHTEEIFGPVVTVVPVDSMNHAIDIVNDGAYGLQTGVFTQDIDRGFDAARRLRVGGVIINDTSSYHADAMPYGGVKADPRIVVLNLQRPARDA